jgi:hypothetical protein
VRTGRCAVGTPNSATKLRQIARPFTGPGRHAIAHCRSDLPPIHASSDVKVEHSCDHPRDEIVHAEPITGRREHLPTERTCLRGRAETDQRDGQGRLGAQRDDVVGPEEGAAAFKGLLRQGACLISVAVMGHDEGKCRIGMQRDEVVGAWL